MARNLKIEGTDSEAARRLATLTPYKSVSVMVTTARQSIQRPDGGTEAAEPDVQTSSQVVPGSAESEAPCLGIAENHTKNKGSVTDYGLESSPPAGEANRDE